MTELRAAPEALLAEVDWLRRLARQLVRDGHAAEDLAQDTVMAALSARRPSRAGTRTWLEGIARKLAALRFRSEDRRRRRERGAARLEGEPSAAQVCADFSMHGSVVQAVMALDESMRVAVVMRFWEDLPPREIARRLEVPVETVRTRIKRGLAQMRARLDTEHGDRRAWALPLLALGPPAQLAPVASPVLWFGVAWMSTKVLVSVAAAVLAVFGLGVAFEVGPLAPRVADSGQVDPRPGAEAARAVHENRSTPAAGGAREPIADPVRTTVVASTGLAGRVIDPSGAGMPDVAVCLARPEFFIDDPRVDPLWFEDPEQLRTQLFDYLFDISYDPDRRGAPDVFGGAKDAFVRAHRVRSGEGGGFRFEEQPAGTLLLCAWHPEHGLRIEVVADSRPIEIVMGDWPRVTGRVTTREGTAIVDAPVEVGTNGRGMPIVRAKTDAGGCFRTLPMPPGPCHVRFDHEGYRSLLVPLGELEEDREVNVELVEKPTFAVRLEDGERQPWTAARLADLGWQTDRLQFLLSARGGHHTHLDLHLTDSTASLRFDGDLGRVEGNLDEAEPMRFLSVWQGHERLTEIELPAVVGASLQIDFGRPEAALTLPVMVVFGQNLTAAPEVDVRLFAVSGALMALTDPCATAGGRTATHSLAVPARLRGKTCYLSVRSDGFAEYVAPIDVPEQGELSPHEAMLRPGKTRLRGRVVDAAGAAVRGATVALATADGSCLRSADPRAYSDDTGHFEFEGLSRRDVRLFVAHDDYAGDSWVAQTDATAPLVLRLTRGTKRQIQLDPHGVQLRVLDAEGAPLFDDRFIDGATRFGRFSLDLPARAQSIEAYRPGDPTPCADATIPPSGEIRMQPR